MPSPFPISQNKSTYLLPQMQVHGSSLGPSAKDIKFESLTYASGMWRNSRLHGLVKLYSSNTQGSSWMRCPRPKPKWWLGRRISIWAYQRFTDPGFWVQRNFILPPKLCPLFGIRIFYAFWGIGFRMVLPK